MPQIVPISLCQAAKATWFYDAMADYTNLFPAVETLHVLSMIVLVGSITAFDLRLLGLALRDEPVSKLAWRLLPATWTAFALMAVTGVLLFTSDPVNKYCRNPALQLKLILIFLAGLNMAVFHFTLYHRVGDWDAAPKTPLSAKLAGSLSVLLWAGVVVLGRWIGFA